MFANAVLTAGISYLRPSANTHLGFLYECSQAENFLIEIAGSNLRPWQDGLQSPSQSVEKQLRKIF